jgi:hypothetical protein
VGIKEVLQMMDQILHDLKTLSPEQLNEIQRVIQAYKGSLENSQIGVGNLHYYGNFLGIGWDDNNQIYMSLGPSNKIHTV